jgi:uncharacterized protein
MPRFEYDFEWDPKKAASNMRKHGVSFEDAATVLLDPKALSLLDDEHSDMEDRWVTIGVDAGGTLLVVSHTWRETGQGAARCRVISARKASKGERRQYWKPNA